MSATGKSATSAATAALGEILQVITSTKIDAFSAVKSRFDAAYATILAAADAAPSRTAELRVLCDGLKSLAVAQTPFHPDVAAVRPVMQLLERDPTAHADSVAVWCTKLRAEIDQGKKRCQYAMLFGQVLSEHAAFTAGDKGADAAVSEIASEDWEAIEAAMAKSESGTSPAAAAAPTDRARIIAESVAKLRAERQATKDEFVERVLTSPPAELADAAPFIEFLRTEVFQFASADQKAFFDAEVAEIATFGKELAKTTITAEDVKYTVEGLLAQGLLDDARQAALRDIRTNAVIHAEIASVLNMYLTQYEAWSWPAAGVRVDFRRQMNGKFRAYLDEDLMTALFLQWVGVQWSCALRGLFVAVHESQLWNAVEVCKRKAAKGQFVGQHATTYDFLRGGSGGRGRGRGSGAVTAPALGRIARTINRRRPNYASSIAEERAEFVRAGFMEQIPSTIMSQGTTGSYDDGDSDSDSDDDSDAGGKASAQAGKVDPAAALKRKQELLHFIAAEARLHRAIRPAGAELVVVRTDFEWFGPSLPHPHLLALLEFLGVPKPWVAFVGRFLAVPTKFADDETPQMRKRGVPISHALSFLLGESMMFLLDFHMIRHGGGAVSFLRLHDDIWMWSADTRKAMHAWKECQRFAKLAGLKFNVEKSGTVVIRNPTAANEGNAAAAAATAAPAPIAIELAEDINGAPGSGFPKGDISWGSVKLSASTGAWEVDAALLEPHVAEFRGRLAAAPTVLAWINVYNRYMRFFVRNFATTAVGAGKAHTEAVQRALADIHRAVFPDAPNGNVVHALAHRMQAAPFAAHVPAGADLLDAWAYWPLTAGGLELWNPFVLVGATQMTIDDEDEEMQTSSLGHVNSAKRRESLDRADANEYRQALERHHRVFKEKYAAKHQISVKKFDTGAAATRYDSDGDDHDEGAFVASAEAKHEDENDAAAPLTNASVTLTVPGRTDLPPLVIPAFPDRDTWLAKRRESQLRHWLAWFDELRREVQPVHVTDKVTAQLRGHLPELKRAAGGAETGGDVVDTPLKGGDLAAMGQYWSWIVLTYGEQLLRDLGSLAFMPSSVVPRAMVLAHKAEKIQWDA
ncbi:hypothetical protein H9P43_009613 [Blastocladiella emersonii ATCC 22665]|nr:hypothetical protein H9P43_009613 [Blastocladiella emersonii ATCC 22665]